MSRRGHDAAALDSIGWSIHACSASAILALTLVCAVAPRAFSAPGAPPYFRPGLRNSKEDQRLNPQQLEQVLDSLRHKTGWQELSFDDSGCLTLGDRTRIAGGSATARALLLAAVDGDQAFELECHNRSPQVAFARLAARDVYLDWPGKERVEVKLLQLDFADFTQLFGDREAVAAFDTGIAVLHELVHGVLHLHDAVDDTTRLGECDEHVNRVRRELEMPERQHYSPRLLMMRWLDVKTAVAELSFVRPGGVAGRAKARTFCVRWLVVRVSIPKDASARRERAPMVAAVP